MNPLRPPIRQAFHVKRITRTPDGLFNVEVSIDPHYVKRLGYRLTASDLGLIEKRPDRINWQREGF